MADEVKAPSQSNGDSLKTAQALGIVLIVILGVFMVTSLNRVNAELVKMNQQVNLVVTATVHNAPSGFQAVNENGDLQWKLTPQPLPERPTCAAMGAGCAAGAGGACPGGANGAKCAAGMPAPGVPAAKK